MGYDGGFVSNLSAIILGLAVITSGFILVGSYRLFQHCLSMKKQQVVKKKMKKLFEKCVHMIHETFNNASIPIMVTSWIQIRDEGIKKEKDKDYLNLWMSGIVIAIFFMYPMVMYFYLKSNLIKLFMPKEEK